jgi:lysophospholipase L1-like esterase
MEIMGAKKIRITVPVAAGAVVAAAGYAAMAGALLRSEPVPRIAPALLVGGAVALLLVLLLGVLASFPEDHQPRAVRRLLASPRVPLPELVVLGAAAAALGSLLLWRVLADWPLSSATFGVFRRPLFALGVSAAAAGSLAVVLGSVRGPRGALLRERVLLTTGAALLSFGLAEAGLRVLSGTRIPQVNPAGAHYRLSPAPGVLPGVEGTASFTTNRLGLRGDDLPADGRYRVLAIGGSTTICVYLDDREAWPRVLQDLLSESAPSGTPVWVGNAGRSGQRLTEHLQVFEGLVPKLDVDAVVVLVGVNDLLQYLRDPESFAERADDPGRLAFPVTWTFSRPPLVDPAISRAFPQNLALWNLAHQVFTGLSFGGVQTDDPTAANYVARRQIFRSAPRVIDRLPELEPGLRRYRADLLTLVELARERKVRLVLATQPVVWSGSLSARADSLLWMGLYGNYEGVKGRYTPEVLAEGMERYNAVVREVCASTGTECVDLAARMNGDERYFFDDVHFTELGARTVARIFAEHMGGTPGSRPPGSLAERR